MPLWYDCKVSSKENDAPGICGASCLKDRGEDGRMACVSRAATAQTVAGTFALLDRCLADRFCFSLVA